MLTLRTLLTQTLLDYLDLARYTASRFSSIRKRDTQAIMQNIPPESLIRTWVWMMSENNDPELMNKGRKNLINAFGSLQNAIKYIEEQVEVGEKN